jgi:hypothetical protein
MFAYRWRSVRSVELFILLENLVGEQEALGRLHLDSCTQLPRINTLPPPTCSKICIWLSFVLLLGCLGRYKQIIFV